MYLLWGVGGGGERVKGERATGWVSAEMNPVGWETWTGHLSQLEVDRRLAQLSKWMLATQNKRLNDCFIIPLMKGFPQWKPTSIPNTKVRAIFLEWRGRDYKTEGSGSRQRQRNYQCLMRKGLTGNSGGCYPSNIFNFTGFAQQQSLR